MILESLGSNKEIKRLLTKIVNAYVEGKKQIEISDEFYTLPGVKFESGLLIDFENITAPDAWYISIRLGIEGVVRIGYSINQDYNNSLSTDDYFHIRHIKETETIETITHLKWLSIW